jgi:hypothetical protein
MVRQTLVIVLVLLIPRCGWGGECDLQSYDADEVPNLDCPSPGEELVVPQLELPRSLAVEEGEQLEVPFDGALVARERLEVMGLRLRAVRYLRWLDRSQARQRADITQTATQRVHAAQLLQMTNHRDYYQALAEQSQGREAWYSSYWFGFVCGAVVAIILAGVSVYALAQLERT